MKLTRSFVLLSLILAIFLIIALGGCQQVSPLQPPSWIIGTWADVALNTSWTFTSDNAIWTTSTSTFSFKQMSSIGMQVSDAETATTYTVSMGSGGITQNYTFIEGDGTVITWESMAILLKQ